MRLLLILLFEFWIAIQFAPAFNAEPASATTNSLPPIPAAGGIAHEPGMIADTAGSGQNGTTNGGVLTTTNATGAKGRAGDSWARPAGINSALDRSQELIKSPNLLVDKQDANRAGTAEENLKKLELARQMKVEKNFAMAEKILTGLMESEAPEDIKRTALLELALGAQEDNQWARAIQVFSQFIKRFPDDPSVPEVILRQGLLFRQLGGNALALTKFYAVMTTALNLKAEHFEYYQKLVLRAQTEIADTYYLLGKYEEAADFFTRLLRLPSAELNRSHVQYKLVRSLANLGRHPEVVAQAQEYLIRYRGNADEPEVRFQLANALIQLGRTRESLQHVLILLEGQRNAAGQSPANWVYWQQRTGNEIANQLYREGDYVNALEIYLNLAPLDKSLSWQLPVWYQIGLVYERLNQPEKAIETFNRIAARGNELGTNGVPSLQAVLEMAKWRRNYLTWQSHAENSVQQYQPADMLSSKPVGNP